MSMAASLTRVSPDPGSERKRWPALSDGNQPRVGAEFLLDTVVAASRKSMFGVLTLEWASAPVSHVPRLWFRLPREYPP
jgi:hypothetical protein